MSILITTGTLLFLYLLQFVVVSLKDGMFTNANVLFKTKFVDGISMVTRTTQTHEGKVLAKRTQEKARDKRQRPILAS